MVLRYRSGVRLFCKKHSNALMCPSLMAGIILLLILSYEYADAKVFCERVNLPLEVGQWKRELFRMDTATIENKPVTMKEGQTYVYENYFPNRTIKYIHVDNLAIKTCGASAVMKTGGVGTSSILIIIHADPYQEIRSVIDIWGTKQIEVERRNVPQLSESDLKYMKSAYLSKH